MANLRKRYLEDYAGGFLNVARQEISSAGEVLVQDGFTSQGTIYVEDGAGVKSGLKLGVSLVEVVDPSTEQGAVNVRFADRTYAKTRDLKIFSTAIASAQAALSEATTISITNLEAALQILEDDVSSVTQTLQNNLENGLANLATLNQGQATLTDTVSSLQTSVTNLATKIDNLENKGGENAISPLSTEININELTGTIQIGSGGTVTGDNTIFSAELNVGDIIYVPFQADPSTNASQITLQEFTVVQFDSTDSATGMTVTPTNVTVPANSKFYLSETNQIKAKLNEVITVLKKLNFIE